jgi:hypothetical protein
MEHFVVYTEKASCIVLWNLLVNGKVKETMEEFWLGIGS